MKKIYKSIAFLLTAFLVIACANDDDIAIAQAEQAPVLIAPEAGASVVLDPSNPTNPALTLVWDHAGFDIETQVNYIIEIAKEGTDFEIPITAGTTANRFLIWTVQELNNASVAAGLIPFQQGTIDIRVKASIGSDTLLEMISNVLSATITPFTTEAPKIAVPGNHQGWNPSSNEVDFVPFLAASAFGETDYEGFVWLDGGYKFVGPNDAGDFVWGNIDWGDDGTFTGTLIEDEEENCEAPIAGYYYVKADTQALTYSAEITNWAIVGEATPLGWPAGGTEGQPGNDHDLTYDPIAKTWSIVIDLSAGEYKFRANDNWTISIGPDSDGDGFLNFGGVNNFTVATPGNYTVVLDLSNPRAYTQTITAN